MPIYEYRCNGCKKRVSILILNTSTTPVCPNCNSEDLTRLMSRFAAPKSEEARLESLADPSKWGDIDENDPASVARFMKKIGKEFGDELGEDFEQEIEAAVEEAAQEGQGDKQQEGGEDTTTGEL